MDTITDYDAYGKADDFSTWDFNNINDTRGSAENGSSSFVMGALDSNHNFDAFPSFDIESPASERGPILSHTHPDRHEWLHDGLNGSSHDAFDPVLLGGDSAGLANGQGYSYDLRPGPRTTEQWFTTWLDQDNSGNYDPAEERKRLFGRKRKSQKPEKVSSCVACTKTGHRCSLADAPTEFPCTGCEMQERTCSLTEDSPQTQFTTSRRTAQASPSRPPPTNTALAVSTKTITTKLCHPLTFNHDLSPSHPCHFCSIPTYPLLGLGPASPIVRIHPLNHSYTELSSGHHANGQEPTRLCILCTTTRVRQLVCAAHNIEPIPGIRAADIDFKAAFGRLVAGDQTEADRWCSVCPAPALYRCYKPCGLLLCETCAVALDGEHKGRLGAMLERLTEGPTGKRPFGLRADAELLRVDGQLVKFMQSRFAA